MSVIKKEVDVSKESSELAQAVVNLVKSVKAHAADGFQAGEDLPAVVLENLQSLSAGLSGADQVGAEAKEDLQAFINAWVLAGTEIAGLYLKKEE